MQVKVYIACSLDGMIARADGGLDWLTGLPNPDNSDFGFADFMSGVDALLMGRNTFETVAGFDQWPYDKPVFVLSKSLHALEPRFSSKAELIQGAPSQVLNKLEARGHRSIYIDGGKTIQGFLNEGLVDELTITYIAKFIGEGIRLFENIRLEQDFSLVGTEVLSDRMLKVQYRRARAGSTAP